MGVNLGRYSIDNFFLGLVIFGICILFILASIADEKGSSWTGFFLLSLFCWPVAGIWNVWILEDNSHEAEGA